VTDVTLIPNRWCRGDRIFFLRGEGAELVRFVWQNARHFSLAHAGTLNAAAAWSAVEVGFAAPDGPGVIVAGDPSGWSDKVELGTV
jgi:hypothetical protein